MQSEVTLSGDPYGSRRQAQETDAEDLPEHPTSVIDSQIKPLIAIDFNGKILEVTPVAAMLLKGDAGRITGGSITAIFPALRDGLERIASPRFTTIAYRLDGSQLPVQMTAMRVNTELLQGWLILLQARKGPTLDSSLAHLEPAIPTTFTLPPA